MKNLFQRIVFTSALGAAIATSNVAFLKPNAVFANSANSIELAEPDVLTNYQDTKIANVVKPPAYPCTRFSPCDYLYERVNIFMRDPQGYCRRKYGGDAYVRRIWGIPFCALPYDRRQQSLA